MLIWWFYCLFVLSFPFVRLFGLAEEAYKSAIGDRGMRRDCLRVAIEAWNQCNEVGEEAPNMGSPRMADCFDVIHSSPSEFLIIYDSSLFIMTQGLRHIDKGIFIVNSVF